MPEEQAQRKPAERPEHAPGEDNLSAAASHLAAGARNVAAETGLEREGPSLATATLVGVGVAILEPELIPGLLIGAGAVLVPKLLPGIGSILRPVVKGVVKAGLSISSTVREAAAGVSEQVEDIVAEARAEQQGGNAAAPSAPAPKRTRRPGTTPAPATNL